MNNTNQASESPSELEDDLAPRTLDWSKAVRGKYYARYQQGTNIALIEPEIHEHFPDSESVNRALRAVLTLRDTVKDSIDSPKHERAA